MSYPSQKGLDMADIKKRLGTRMGQLRIRAGLTQAKLAEKAHLSVDLISRIERGERAPSLESIESIARVLGAEPMELLNFQGKELEALAEGPVENLELWNLLRNKKRDQVKKLYEIAKIVLG
jgi:DNA-binding XRE family transcriptional regulator